RQALPRPAPRRERPMKHPVSMNSAQRWHRRWSLAVVLGFASLALPAGWTGHRPARSEPAEADAAKARQAISAHGKSAMAAYDALDFDTARAELEAALGL